jgi:hypothetical protein
MSVAATPPYRQVRAAHTEDTITVYQAYSPAIAGPALAAGTFVPPFRVERMTWIKPSFLWMAYRSGWAAKEGQERVLAVRISRAGFRWALAHSCLSHYEPAVHASEADWARRLREAPVRVQWDPERGLRHEPLDHRAIQVGLRGPAVERYVGEWIVAIDDVTERMHRIGGLVAQGRTDEAAAALPDEPPYPLDDDIASIIGATAVSRS